MNAEYAARYPKLAAASPEREPEKPPYAPFELKNDPITPEPEEPFENWKNPLNEELRRAVNKRGIDPTQRSGKSAAMAEQIEKLRASGAIISTSERDRHWLAATAERAALRKIAEECNEAYIRGLALDALLGEVKA
jgi:hypothetical protein